MLVLHLMTAIIGIGGVFLLGLFGREAERRKGTEGQGIAEAAYKVGEVAEYFIYAIPVFGIILLFLSGGHAYWFDQTWVWLALVLYIAALSISHALHLPNLRRMNAVMAELNVGGPPPPGAGGPPPQVAELEDRGKRAGINVIVTVIVVLMVWKPGL